MTGGRCRKVEAGLTELDDVRRLDRVIGKGELMPSKFLQIDQLDDIVLGDR